ncbi:MAG: hypothetical protein JNM72_16775 [Deltaproteobacteria bacterium]|jgi:hypothetical protein|nr:hypothetical protein [Deltaproteobacteria bacterium]
MMRAPLPLPALHNPEPLSAALRTYIDVTILSSALSGLIILALGLYGWAWFNRLWHGTLRDLAAPAMAAAEARGLRLRPPGLRARLVAEGNLGSQSVRIEWRGGAFGEQSRVYLGDLVDDLPLICSAEALDAALRPRDPPPTA